MATIVRDSLWFCDDCSIASVNGDLSGIYDAEREAAVVAGMERLAREGYAAANNDSETGDGIRDFARIPCDCCGSQLHGSRSRFCLLSK